MEIVTEKKKKRAPTNPDQRSARIGDIFRPLEPLPSSVYTATLLISIVIIIGVWAIISYSGIVHPAFFLPNPTQVIVAAGQMIQTGELFQNGEASLIIILSGWAIAAVVSIPVGILMGTYKVVEAFFEPPIDFMRYLPISALIPLLILWVGIDEKEKITVIFLGTFFQLVLIVADVASHVSKDLLDSAYTLGVSRWRVLTTVLIPATLPGVMDALRITLGWAWTYLIVAELIAADHGLGVMIMESERGFRTDKIFVGLVTIGLLGFISDFIFKWLHPKLLPWSPRLH